MNIDNLKKELEQLELMMLDLDAFSESSVSARILEIELIIESV